MSERPDMVEPNSLDYVLEFQRFEFKYLIHNRIAEMAKLDIAQHMALDKHCPNGRPYSLFSVYFDTDDWQAYYEKLDGIKQRKKFRVRSYRVAPEPDDEVLLEIKEKNKDVIFKRRTPLPNKVASELLGSLHIPNWGMGEDDAVAQEWRRSIIRNGLKPKILVAYERTAFSSKNNSDVRVTFDSSVNWARPRSGNDFAAHKRPVPNLRDHTVLEIKFSRFPPGYIGSLIRRYNLTSEAVSKYCETVLAFHRSIY